VDPGSGHVDEAKTRQTYFEGLPKIVLLRPDLLVGVTGDDPDLVIERLIAQRSAPFQSVIAFLKTQRNADFVIAGLNPTALWSVLDGRAEDRSVSRRAWAGDLDAYNIFRSKYHDPGHGDDVWLRLLSSMQFLTSFDPVESVGGITLMASTFDDGFHFVSGASMIGPHDLQVESIQLEGDTLTLRAVVPPGVDPTMFQTFVLSGAEATLGAVAFLIPQTGQGLLFRQDRPWEAVRIPASTTRELANAAWAIHSESVVATASPPGFPLPFL
jgi:hypothetical protein